MLPLSFFSWLLLFCCQLLHGWRRKLTSSLVPCSLLFIWGLFPRSFTFSYFISGSGFNWCTGEGWGGGLLSVSPALTVLLCWSLTVWLNVSSCVGTLWRFGFMGSYSLSSLISIAGFMICPVEFLLWGHCAVEMGLCLFLSRIHLFSVADTFIVFSSFCSMCRPTLAAASGKFYVCCVVYLE